MTGAGGAPARDEGGAKPPQIGSAENSPEPLSIVTRPQTAVYWPGETISFSVEVSSPEGPVTCQWYQNKRPIPGATGQTLTIPSAGLAQIGDYYVEIAAPSGRTNSFPDDASRAVMRGAFVIEAEDYNHSGGQTISAASVMPLTSDLYRGKDGLPDIDFHNGHQSTDDPLAHGSNLRNGWSDFGIAVPFPPSPPGGNVDVIEDTAALNRERPDFTIHNNYKIGWGGTGDWYQYTRDFPPGHYGAVWVGSRDGRSPGIFGRSLEIVTGDVTQPGAAATEVGEFVADGTGAWSSNDQILFLQPGNPTSPAAFPLGPQTTVRLRHTFGEGDSDYLLFYQISHCETCSEVRIQAALNPDSTVTFSWAGPGTLEIAESVHGPYRPIPEAANSHVVTPGESAAFARVRP